MLPTMKIGDNEITRLIVGTNPFGGKSHLDKATSEEMKEYYTEERIFASLRRCEEVGINTVQSRGSMPMMGIIGKYRANGGKMLYLAQTGRAYATFEEELKEIVKYNPAGICLHGDLADDMYLGGEIDKLGDMLELIRKTGLPTGLCAHFPEVLEYAEEKKWKVDYYMASMYNLNQPDRSHDVNPTGERFEDSDIPKMYETIRHLSAPTFALKILGAGRRCATQEAVRACFDEAFANMKKGDGVLVGMFDKHIDQAKLDAEYTADAIAKCGK